MMSQSFGPQTLLKPGQSVNMYYGGVTANEGNMYYGPVQRAYPQAPEMAPYPVKPLETRARLNVTAIAVSLIVPWVVFILMSLVVSFEWHARRVELMRTICAIVLILVLSLGGLAAFSAATSSGGRTWGFFLFVTSLIAWIAGVIAGHYNYALNMRPYYDVTSLNLYPSVDPALSEGQQIMDAGRIIFTATSRIDLSKTMGFQNRDVYCVAPIVNGPTPPVSYDFWAVGLNCCGNGAFTCGEASNPNAHAGLRLMRDDQRPYFRLAVQQAEAQYNVQANHPIFLTWMADPMNEVNAFEDNGLKYFIIGIFAHVACQLFLVVVAAIAFTKLGVS